LVLLPSKRRYNHPSSTSSRLSDDARPKFRAEFARLGERSRVWLPSSHPRTPTHSRAPPWPDVSTPAAPRQPLWLCTLAQPDTAEPRKSRDSARTRECFNATGTLRLSKYPLASFSIVRLIFHLLAPWASQRVK
jgi:hypothetical protein